ncbi:hypothetical protein G9A89_007870 [Geosiphon pyriformis]|nr:hypothetical protein G9A89_007870 [Geosiphon pyriformis]
MSSIFPPNKRELFLKPSTKPITRLNPAIATNSSQNCNHTLGSNPTQKKSLLTEDVAPTIFIGKTKTLNRPMVQPMFILSPTIEYANSCHREEAEIKGVPGNKNNLTRGQNREMVEIGKEDIYRDLTNGAVQIQNGRE